MASIRHLSPLNDAVADLGLEALRSTVRLRVRGAATGSGVIWGDTGTVITNAHVATRSTIEVELGPGLTVEGELQRRDRRRDLAAVRISHPGLASAVAGDSQSLRPGEVVVACGNPFDLGNSLAIGVIHSARTVRPPHIGMIHADLRLLPGFSGGPMVNSRGEVIGINTMVAGGLGLAIPSREVEHFINRTSRPPLGISVRSVPIGVEANETHGYIIVAIEPSSLASRFGLMLGDILIRVNGMSIAGSPREIDGSLEPLDDKLALEVIRAGELRHVEVDFAAAEARASGRAA